MSEMNERNMEGGAPAAENEAAVNQAAPQAVDMDKENAPGDAAAPAADKSGDKDKKKNRKKRKKNGIAVPLVALLLVIALVFGLVMGYGFGRNVGTERLLASEARIEELTFALQEAQSAPVYNAFDEELTDENQKALNELAGNDFSGEQIASELIGENGVQSVDETEAAEPVVVAEFEGGKLMSDAVAREYNEQMATLVFAGFDADEIADNLLDEVLKYMVSDQILEQRAREMGLYELTEADEKLIDEEAERVYNEKLDFYRGFVNTNGMTEEEANGAVKAYLMEAEGMDYDTVRADIAEGWWAQKIFDEITGEAELTETALQAAYESRLVEQKETFENYPDSYEFSQRNGEIILYNLSGYRAVRMLLFGFEDPEATEAVSVMSDEIAAMDPEEAAQEIADYRAAIDGFYASSEARAQGALDELHAGADFDEMLLRLGDDAGMKDERLRSTGYYISADSLLWPPEIIAAAMALEQPGDISAAVRTGDGVCILEYVGDVTAGAVALDDVRDELGKETLEIARYEAYETQMNEWIEEAGVKYYPERMQ